MNDRRTWLACAVAVIVASIAGRLAAQTFEQTVDSALNKDGALYQQSQTLKQSQDQNDQADTLNPDRGHPGGGGGHGHPPGGGGHHPGHGNPGHGHPPPHRHGHQHEAPNRDWGRWHGHPGWGSHYGRWDWHDGYPHWWDWLIWSGTVRYECINYYDGLLGQCNDSCEIENHDCVAACHGDEDCAAQCDSNSESCYDTCTVDYDGRVASCPAFITPTKPATTK